MSQNGHINQDLKKTTNDKLWRGFPHIKIGSFKDISTCPHQDHLKAVKRKEKNKYLISKSVTARHGEAELPPNIITMSVVARHGGESPLQRALERSPEDVVSFLDELVDVDYGPGVLVDDVLVE